MQNLPEAKKASIKKIKSRKKKKMSDAIQIKICDTGDWLDNRLKLMPMYFILLYNIK
jgi:hypothetical protein